MTYKNIDIYDLIKPEVIKLRNIGIETANLDCRLLLSKSLDRRVSIYNHQNICISQREFAKYQSLIQQQLIQVFFLNRLIHFVFCFQLT